MSIITSHLIAQLFLLILGLITYEITSAAPPPPLRQSQLFKLKSCDRLLLRLEEAISQLDGHLYFPLVLPAETMWTIGGETYNVDPAIDDIFLGGVTRQDTEFFRKSTVFANREQSPEVYDLLSQESASYREVLHHIDFVFETYLKRGILAADEIAELKAQERDLDIRRTFYVAFTDPKSKSTKAVIRLYDGTPTPGVYGGPYGGVIQSFSSNKLPIEKEFPHLILPERARYGDAAELYEIGRLSVSQDTGSGVVAMLSQIANFFSLKNGFLSAGPKPGTIYISAIEEGAKLYKNKYGFEQVYGPEELKLPAGHTGKYILRTSVEKFYYDYVRGYFSPRPR